MARYSKKMWNGEGPEPVDYNQVADPTCAVYTSTSEFDKEVNAVASLIKKWLGCKGTELDNAIHARWTSWESRGGSRQVWDSIMAQAFAKSQYAKEFSRQVRETPPPPQVDPYLPRIAPRQPSPRGKFNGLDFSGIRL